MSKKTTMETMISEENQNEATEVLDFLTALNQNQKKEFLTFLRAAKFVKNLTEEGEVRTSCSASLTA